MAILAHVYGFGLRPEFPPPHTRHICHTLYLEGGLRLRCCVLFWPETSIFGRFWCFAPALLKLEPLTFNPSVLGSNPRGPTNPYYLRGDYTIVSEFRFKTCR